MVSLHTTFAQPGVDRGLVSNMSNRSMAFKRTACTHFLRCALQSGTKMDTVIGAVPKTTLVQTLDKYVD